MTQSLSRLAQVMSWGKPVGRSFETKSHEIFWPREDRPAERFGFNPRSRHAGLVISGQESPASLGNNAEGAKACLEEPSCVGRGCPAKRRARRRDQFRRCGLRCPGTYLPPSDRPPRALERAERRLMVVIGPAREAFEIQRLEARPHGDCYVCGGA